MKYLGSIILALLLCAEGLVLLKEMGFEVGNWNLPWESREGSAEPIGRVSSRSGEVRSRSAHSLSWHSLKENDVIRQNESVLTSRDSTTRIEIKDGQGKTIVDLKSESLVTFKKHRVSQGIEQTVGRLAAGEADFRTESGLVLLEIGSEVIQLNPKSSVHVVSAPLKNARSIQVIDGTATIKEGAHAGEELRVEEKVEKEDRNEIKTAELVATPDQQEASTVVAEVPSPVPSAIVKRKTPPVVKKKRLEAPKVVKNIEPLPTAELIPLIEIEPPLSSPPVSTPEEKVVLAPTVEESPNAEIVALSPMQPPEVPQPSEIVAPSLTPPPAVPQPSEIPKLPTVSKEPERETASLPKESEPPPMVRELATTVVEKVRMGGGPQNRIRFEWKGKQGNLVYRFQLSENSEFESIVRDVIVTENYAELILPSQSDFFWRVTFTDGLGKIYGWTTSELSLEQLPDVEENKDK